MLKSINPFDQSLLGEYPELNENALEKKLDTAIQTFRQWRKESFAQRASLMKKAGDVLRSKKSGYAEIISREMGKVLKEAEAEIEKCASACDFFAERAEDFLKDQVIPSDASKSFVCYQPLGPVLAIMPWNFPFWQVFRFAVPGLMAGNVGLLKHASNVSQCSLAIEEIFREAGFPEGAFQSLLIGSGQAEKLIAHDHIAAVTLTGSEFAGTRVAAAAGKNIKKTVLELGGSDPFIVLEDAALKKAAQVPTHSRMQNAGQSCIAAKRFIVVKSVADDFLGFFKKEVDGLRQGNPLLKDTTTGPMARKDLAEDLEKQMQASIKSGAQLVTGGTRKEANFRPALLTKVSPGMPAFDEETFGPLAAVIVVKDEAEAVQKANDHRYGLGASVWTEDPGRGEKVAREIESGNVFVNSLMRSDQRLPFGGIKKSGYGRELSELGIKEFMNAKTIYIS